MRHHREQRQSEEPDVAGHPAQAFDNAKVSAEIEVHKIANHGWMPPDSQNHNTEAAQRGLARKLETFKKARA